MKEMTQPGVRSEGVHRRDAEGAEQGRSKGKGKGEKPISRKGREGRQGKAKPVKQFTMKDMKAIW